MSRKYCKYTELCIYILNSHCFLWQKNKNKKKGKDDKYGSEVTTPENSSSPGMMDMHGNHTPLIHLTAYPFPYSCQWPSELCRLLLPVVII